MGNSDIDSATAAVLSSSSPPSFSDLEARGLESSAATSSSVDYSDDLAALHEVAAEVQIEKNKQSVVIQHRRSDVGLSSGRRWSRSSYEDSEEEEKEEQQQATNTPSKKPWDGRRAVVGTVSGVAAHENRKVMATTTTKKTLESSPVRYPESSSPVPTPAPRREKRKRVEDKETAGPSLEKKRRIFGGFVDDDDDDDDEEEVEEGVDVGEVEARIVDGRLRNGLVGETESSKVTPAARDRVLTAPEAGMSISGVEVLKAGRDATRLVTSSGKRVIIPRRIRSQVQSYESIVAARSVTDPRRAKKSFYGIEIHQLIDEAKEKLKADKNTRNEAVHEEALPSIEKERPVSREGKRGMTKMWTEKYRAKKFTDLVGDERTHRHVLRWMKGWDPIVFPGSQPPSLRKKQFAGPDRTSEEKQMRKIMLLTGPPGLGKTTLAHVCAKQAGYEVLEINASDERSRDVVKGRIKDALGTENVRGVSVLAEDKKVRKAGKPICVVVDEVDGVVSGSAGSGEGGFIKALIDLVQLDQKNSARSGESQLNRSQTRKGDTFRLLRPLILICNDVYHPSLRPLRTSSIAEIVHVRKPPLDKVIIRLKTVLQKEGIHSDNDGVRRLCEATWGIGSRKQGQANSRGSGEGDMRGILVAGEWAAQKLRSSSKDGAPRLTRKWVEEHTLTNTTSDMSTGARGLGRGGVREVVDRVFLEGAGLSSLPAASDRTVRSEQPTGTLGVTDIRKRTAMNALREMLDTTGEHDRCVADCFSTFPSQVYQDDTLLSKPIHAYDWLHFHDALSSRVFGNQEWELMPYMPQATLAFHNLFAAVGRNVWDSERAADKEDKEDEEVHPFAGVKADFVAHEAHKQNSALLSEFQSSFTPSLMRLFRSLDMLATELLPNVVKMTAPDVKPVIVGGSAGSVASVRKEAEKQCITLGTRAMSGLGIKFEKARVEFDNASTAQGGWVYRMEPALDELTTFYMGKQSGGPPAPVRYAVRQVLDQELRKAALLQRSDRKEARYSQGARDSHEQNDADDDKENDNDGDIKEKAARAVAAGKRDFFGRIVNEAIPTGSASEVGRASASSSTKADAKRVWVSFHEGYSNAVRKPITLKELMGSFL